MAVPRAISPHRGRTARGHRNTTRRDGQEGGYQREAERKGLSLKAGKAFRGERVGLKETGKTVITRCGGTAKGG